MGGPRASAAHAGSPDDQSGSSFDERGEGLRAKMAKRRAALKRLAAVQASGELLRNDLLPELTLVHRAPDALRIPTCNVRKRDAPHIREVANSMQAFGVCAPVLIDAEITIIDGVILVEAAKLIGLATVPCIVAGHLNASQKRLLRITLNRLQEKGGFDFDELKLELEELILEGSPRRNHRLFEPRDRQHPDRRRGLGR